MSSKTDVRLTPGERLARGLKYTAVGPVDVTGERWERAALGPVVGRVDRRPLPSGRGWPGDLAAAQETIAHELAAAQEVVAELPQAMQEARQPKRRRRPLLLAAAAAAVLAGGAVVFSIVRRSTQPEPSPRPPSVDASAQALISGNLKAPARQSLRSLAEFFVEPRGFEPLTSALQRQRSTN